MHRVLDTPGDLKARLAAERRGVPFLVFRDPAGVQRIITLDASRGELTVGRAEECDVHVEADREMSRLHTLLTPRGISWTCGDPGLSRNGTFLNGERIMADRILRNGDLLRAGKTDFRFFDPRPERTRTVPAHDARVTAPISPAQKKVLIALCRPYRDRLPFVRPASNQQIADELVLSEETVRTHLRALFAICGMEDVPQGEKRIRLVQEAFVRGIVGDSDFADEEPSS